TVEPAAPTTLDARPEQLTPELQRALSTRARWGLSLATSGDFEMAIDTRAADRSGSSAAHRSTFGQTLPGKVGTA
ncbi:MAG TPA: hypothetical protein VGV93_07670, partial [Acidimicrobiales bacterium]|nr:hypothetical protein [Acidimicrobiales bacterium]